MLPPLLPSHSPLTLSPSLTPAPPTPTPSAPPQPSAAQRDALFLLTPTQVAMVTVLQNVKVLFVALCAERRRRHPHMAPFGLVRRCWHCWPRLRVGEGGEAGGVGERLVTQVLRMNAGSRLTLSYFHFSFGFWVSVLLANRSGSTVHRECIQI